MVDPLSALSLAGNIIQFIDFGCKLISESREICRSGVPAQYVDLQIIAESLGDLSRSLLPTSPSEDDLATPKPQGEALERIAASCRGVADEILSTLNKLRLGDGLHGRWQSFCQALKVVWKKDRIEALRSRLDDLRSQLNIQICLISK